MKQFASVMFGLVLITGLISFGQNNVPYDPAVEKEKLDYQKQRDEKNDKKTADRELKQDEKAEKSEAKQQCTEAMKEYTKANKQNPCPTAASSKACYEKIAACQNSTGVTPGSAGIATGNDSIDAIANSALEMIKAQKEAKQNSSTDVNPDRSCYAAIQMRDKDAAKERKSQKDQIIKDIEAADKELREANEKLKEKTNEIKVDQQKLQAETQKALQKLEVDKREKLTKMNEDLQKAATDIRKQTTDIIKTKQAMEKLKFEHQKTMMSHTEEKINQQCKSALDTAKTCFVKASKGKKFEKDDVCSNFSFSGSGTKGTAELKKKLIQVKDACFEQSNQTVSTLKYDYEDKVRNYNMDITEKQEQIADANKSLELKKKENESIDAENAKEKSQEEKNLEQQMANLTEKLTGLEKSTAAAVKSSEDKITRLNLELKDLKAGALANEVADPGSQSIYDNIANDAQNALGEISNATAAAFGACCIMDKKKPLVRTGSGVSASTCSMLNQENSDAAKRSTEKTKNNSNK